MKSQLWIGVVVSLFLSASLMAQEVSVTQGSEPFSKKYLHLFSATQYIGEAAKFESVVMESQSNFVRTRIGAEYLFSDISTIKVSLPIVYQLYESVLFPKAQATKFRSTQLYTDRLRADVEGKLFLNTLLGQISWFTQAYFPTMVGFDDIENNFYNYYSLHLGVKNIFPVASLKAFLFSQAGYIFKFKRKFNGIERKYGNEIAANAGFGYLILPKLSSSLGVHYSKIDSFKESIADVKTKTHKGAMALHLVPGLSYALNDSVSFQAHSRVLLERSKIRGLDSGFLWGSLEDQGEFLFQLGFKLGII